MKKIKLKDEYHWCNSSEYIDVTDEIAEVFANFEKAEHRYLEKVRYHKAFYSLDEGNGIENDAISCVQPPDKLYEDKINQAELYAAISQLSDTQAKRIYEYYFQHMTLVQIAKTEGVDESAIRHSIQRGLR